MISVFEKHCNEGDGNSCLLVGLWFSDGIQTLPNDEKSALFFEKGANLNDFESCCNLGRIYQNGQGVEQDYDKAKLYYQKACNGGYKCGCEGLEELLALVSEFDNGILNKCGASTIEYSHHDSGIVFVDRMGSLVFNGTRGYDDPNLGVSVAYNAIGITSTIFIYDLGVENISDELFSDAVANQFHQADNDAMRYHENANMLSMDIIELSSNKFALHESIEFTENNIKKHSHIFVWGYNNNFIKIRFTYDADIEEEAIKVLEDQLLYMSQYVSEGTLTYDKGLEVFQKEDLRLAYMIWNHLVEKGDIPSMYGLSIVHMSSENIEHALYWLNKSAEEGYPMAQYDLGQTYCDGDLVEKDMHKCAYWIKKARDNGYEEEYDIWNELSLDKYIIRRK